MADVDFRKQNLPHISSSFNSQDVESSTINLVRQLPGNENLEDSQVKVDQMTDGITNIIIKATPQRSGQSKADSDEQAVLIRAYGKDTELLIDRRKELRVHDMLASMGLAAKILATYENGFICNFIPGDITEVEDYHKPEIYRQIAKTLGRWHASLPISVLTSDLGSGNANTSKSESDSGPVQTIWMNAKRWIDLLPSNNDELKARNDDFRKELEWLSGKFSSTPGLNGQDYVFSHTDLLPANVLMAKQTEENRGNRAVTFIDYEYAMAAPPAFDIANFFAEWAGPDGELAWMPPRSNRLDFIEHYVTSFWENSSDSSGQPSRSKDTQADMKQLADQVELFRGLPGFYWGIWGMIQASISDIDFDYVYYAERRHSEYWGWKEEYDGSREREGREMTIREKAWARE